MQHSIIILVYHITEVWKLGVSLLADVFTDLNALLLFIRGGQPFFAMYMVVTMAQASMKDDMFHKNSIMAWFWSRKHAYPHHALIERKSKEQLEATAALFVSMSYFLAIPSQDEFGRPLMSWVQSGNFILSMLFTLYGLFDGAEAYKKWLQRVLHVDGKHLDLTEEFLMWKHTKSSRFNFALGFVVSRVAFAGSMAMLAQYAHPRKIVTVGRWWTSLVLALGVIAALVYRCFKTGCCLGKEVSAAVINILGFALAAPFQMLNTWDEFRSGSFDTVQLTIERSESLAVTMVDLVRVGSVWATLIALYLAPFAALYIIYDVFEELKGLTERRISANPDAEADAI